ncbi:MAG TPA: hypothetical protein VJO35_04485 [Terriglobales bacterium]|nr:hypothetical protein [Terriglobales bacterium]
MRHARICLSGLLVGCLCLLVSYAHGQDSAQEFPRVEIFFGYSYLRIDTLSLSPTSFSQQCAAASGVVCPFAFELHPGFNGWSLAPQFNFTDWLGLKLQISGQYGSFVTVKVDPAFPLTQVPIPSQRAYDVLFGGVVSHRTRRYTLFAHGLLGLEDFGISTFHDSSAPVLVFPTTSTTDTAFDFGGGIDLRIWKFFAIRAGEFDYQFVNTSDYRHRDDFRYSGGIVLRLGQVD